MSKVAALPKKIAPRSGIFDSLVNLISGLGGERDKSYYNQYGFTVLDYNQLVLAYRGDWIARKVVDIPSGDMTRAWRAWQASDPQIEKIDTVERTLRLQQKIRRALTRSRLFGGSLLVMGVDNTGRPEEELILDRVKADSLRYVHVMVPSEVAPQQLVWDVESPYYGEAQWYEIRRQDAAPVKVHASRTVRFLGNELPDPALSSDGWGDSVLQTLDDAVKNCGLVTGSTAAMVHDARLDVISIPDLAQAISTEEGKNLLIERFQLANLAKSIVNTTILDAAETWNRKDPNFGGLPDLLKLYLLIASGAADIPATRLLGQSPAGMDATGDSDTRNYYDRLSSDQENELGPNITRLDEVLIRSALGSRPPEVHYWWKPLWEMSETDKATVAASKATAHRVDVELGLIDADALRKGRENQLVEDGFYPGFEAALQEAEEAGVDETDPDVEAAFGEIRAGGAAEGGAPLPTDNVQATGLNGAQIASLQAIVKAVQKEGMPAETGKAMIEVSFPALSPEQIDRLIDPVELIAEEEEETPPPGQPGGPPITDPDAAAIAAGNGPRPPRNVPPALRLVSGDAATTPRTLYVRRDVLNAAAIVRWAKAQGFKNIVPADKMHVTILYSRTPVDWMAMGEGYGPCCGDGEFKVPAGGPRLVEKFGNGAVVLAFSSSTLAWRHEEMVQKGGQHDFPEYQPHVTISYDAGDVRVASMEPYRGEIVLGPEIFEEVRDLDEPAPRTPSA